MSRSDGKTEHPTPRRKRQARREGQVARSQEVSIALSLLGALLALHVFLPSAAAAFRDHTALLFANATGDELPVGLLRHAVGHMVLATIAPFAVIAVVAGVAGGVGQVGFMLAPKAARPKFSNLKLKRGLARLKPARMGWELVRNSAKLGLLAVLLWGPLTDMVTALGTQPNLDRGLKDVLAAAVDLLVRGTALALLVAAADYAWNRARHIKQLKMTRQEVKREHKDTEGDPLLKLRRRRKAEAHSRNRMIRDVTDADVVVTNPLHLAVALRYDPAEAAPRVVAKGANKLAARIRAAASRHGVPLTEDRPLAQALYRRCQVGQHVPKQLYEAVAVVLALAYRRRGVRVPMATRTVSA